MRWDRREKEELSGSCGRDSRLEAIEYKIIKGLSKKFSFQTTFLAVIKKNLWSDSNRISPVSRLQVPSGIFNNGAAPNNVNHQVKSYPWPQSSKRFQHIILSDANRPLISRLGQIIVQSASGTERESSTKRNWTTQKCIRHALNLSRQVTCSLKN